MTPATCIFHQAAINSYKPFEFIDSILNYGIKKNTYALQSFAVHDGSLGGGHYYAICRNYLDDNWYQYNDTHVTRLDEDDILDYAPYLFFYKRQ